MPHRSTSTSLGTRARAVIRDCRILANDVRHVAIAAMPLWSHGLPRRGAAPALPPGRFVELPQRGRFFVRTCDGPSNALPVVLMHGCGLTADFNFFPLYQPLSQYHPVIAFDAHFHGRSVRPAHGFRVEDSADDAAALLDLLGIERAIVCGYSLGGVTAVMTAVRHPDRVAGVVPQAAAAYYLGLARDAALFQFLRGVSPLAGEGKFGRTMMARYGVRAARRDPQLAAYWPWALSELQRNSARDVVTVAAATRASDLRELLADILPMRAAYVLTTRDRVCRPPLQRELARLIGAHVIPIAADHDAPIAARDAYVPATLEAIDYVAGCPASQDTARTPRSGMRPYLASQPDRASDLASRESSRGDP